MAKIVVSIDGVVVKEVQLTKERTTLGRRPYNDIDRKSGRQRRACRDHSR